MNQKMVCQRGSCEEDISRITDFGSLFESSNIVEEMQKEIMINLNR
jgi:hypothetical protein